MNILAAFIFFTRLPFWKIREVPAECFKHVVPYWPLTGWLTGGIMAGTLWLTGQILPVSLAWIIAIIARLFVTGCLHEDGLADFLDGRRHHPRAYACHHERFPYRKLRSYRTDILFPAAVTDAQSTSEFPLYPCLLRRLLVQVLRIPTH